jgi:hypothetical protein
MEPAPNNNAAENLNQKIFIWLPSTTNQPPDRM